HVLDGQKSAAYHDVRFPPPGGPRGADVVVGVLARANDGAVTDAARDLERQTARGRDRGDVARGVHDIEVDRAGRADDHRGRGGHVEPVVVRAAVGPPFEP